MSAPNPLHDAIEQILDEELDRAYLTELLALQLELLKLQQHLVQTGGRLLVLFEGRDAAGKGGAISRFAQNLNPRQLRVVALSKPTEVERGQWYFQRHLLHLPNPGELVFFDRSWYNRAVVEPVFGFCTPAQHQRFLDQVVSLETMLVDDGLVLVKLWFSIVREEQARRLEQRERNPLRRWKLSPIDRAAQERWADFTQHKETMFARTSTDAAPWHVVVGNNKKVARLQAIRHVLGRVDYPDKDEVLVELDPAVVRRV